MGRLENVKLLADISKIMAEIWGIWRDKNKSAEERDRRIKELEAELAKLKDKDKPVKV